MKSLKMRVTTFTLLGIALLALISVVLFSNPNTEVFAEVFTTNTSKTISNENLTLDSNYGGTTGRGNYPKIQDIRYSVTFYDESTANPKAKINISYKYVYSASGLTIDTTVPSPATIEVGYGLEVLSVDGVLCHEKGGDRRKNGTTYTLPEQVLALQWNREYSIRFQYYRWYKTASNNSKIVTTLQFSIRLKKDAPTGTLSGVENGGLTNGPVSFHFADGTSSALLDGADYISGVAISEEGEHIIKLSNKNDIEEKYTIYSFTIDKTKPTLQTESGKWGYTNKALTLTANDDVTKDGIKIYCRNAGGGAWELVGTDTVSVSRSDGEWEFYAIDGAGNRSETYKIIFDSIVPNIGLRRVDGTPFADGGWSNQGVYFSVNDATNTIVKVYRSEGGSWIEVSGDYIVGSVYYDTRKETILYGSREQAQNAIEDEENSRIISQKAWKTIVNDTRIIAAGQIDYAIEGSDYWEYSTTEGEVYVFFIQSDLKTYVKNRLTNYIGSKSCETFEMEGSFKVVATDAAGNIAEKTFSIKKTLPTLEIVPSGYTSTDIRYRVIDPYILQTSIKIDNGSWVIQDSSDLTILSTNGDGTYYFRTIDVAGNVVIASVVLDTQAPALASSEVENQGYINKSVSVSVFDNNLADVFYRSLGGEWLKGGSVVWMGGTNGIWEAYAIDKAGNRSEIFSFTYDNIAPVGSILKLDGSAAGEYYNAAVRFESIDEVMIKRLEVLSPNGDWAGFNGTLSEVYEGIWQFRGIDAAGNRSVVYSIEIDLTSPILTLQKNNAAVEDGFFTKGDDQLAYYISDKNASGIEIDGLSVEELPKNTQLSDGVHLVVAFDKAGNRSEPFSFNVDKALPTLTLQSLAGEGLTPAADGVFYTNAALRIEGADAYFASLCVYKGQNIVFDAEVKSADFAAITANFGVYSAFAEDLAGNRSEEAIFVIQIINDFGNISEIYRSFKINAWYEVVLPSYVFGTNPMLENISGRYSFERREDAYAWALAVEELYRVQKQREGWIYVSATNEAVAQVYTSRSDLDKVIAKYASRYIGTRKVSSVNGNDNYNTIKDPDGRTDENAFIRQTVKLPTFLAQYAELELIQIKSSYVFGRLKSALSPTSVNLTYLADDFGLSTPKKIDIGYTESIKTVLNAADMLKQGYYLCEETDLCGNSQRFLIYIDFEAPKINAEIMLGDYTKKELILDTELSAANSGVFYYLSFDFKALLDNVDDFLALRIDGRGATGLYIAGDELPILNAELGGGQYVLTLYDRSGNVFTTKVNIATKLPTMEHNSLKATNRQLTLQFQTNDTLNSITKLEMYKINGKGDRVRIERDDLGVEIDFTTLEYNFTIGGKYLAVITDRYGRVVETIPIFYQRGLPYGELSVSESGTTNKDVTFSYAVGNAVVVYTYGATGSLEVYTDYLSVYDNIQKMYELTFIASTGIEKQFLIYLYAEADDNLFMEYKFGIDTIIAEVTAQAEGNNIEKGGYTNKPFTLWWTESNVRVKYTIGDNGITHNYERGDTLTGNGLYVFRITDQIGNTETFEIYLDNIVEYSLDGEGRIVNVGGKYLSNAAVTVRMNEACSEWSVADGKLVSDGVPIVLEGLYTITIADRFKNRITIVIEIDLTPPELTLIGVAVGGATKNNVKIEYGIDAKCYLTRSGAIIREVMNGEEFNTHGSYTLRAEDLVGNATEMTFSIDLCVDYESDIFDNYITTDLVKFSLVESGIITIMRDGQPIEATGDYSEVGVYALSATDTVGNSMTLRWTILPKNAKTLTINLAAEHQIDAAKLNGNDVEVPYGNTKRELNLMESGNWEITVFDTAIGQQFSLFIAIDNIVPTVEIVYNKKNNTVSFVGLNKTNITATLTRDGTEIKWTQSLVLKDAGVYVLTLTDSFGNSSSIEFEIEYKLNALSVTIIVFSCLAVVGIVAWLLYRRFKIKTA